MTSRQRLRRTTSLGVALELGDVALPCGPETGRQGLAVVVAHADGYPRRVTHEHGEVVACGRQAATSAGRPPSPRSGRHPPSALCAIVTGPPPRGRRTLAHPRPRG